VVLGGDSKPIIPDLAVGALVRRAFARDPAVMMIGVLRRLQLIATHRATSTASQRHELGVGAGKTFAAWVTGAKAFPANGNHRMISLRQNHYRSSSGSRIGTEKVWPSSLWAQQMGNWRAKNSTGVTAGRLASRSKLAESQNKTARL